MSILSITNMNGVTSLGSDFEIVGTASLSSTGRSVRLKIMPAYSIFEDYYFVSVSDLEKILRKHKKTGTIYTLKDGSE